MKRYLFAKGRAIDCSLPNRQPATAAGRAREQGLISFRNGAQMRKKQSRPSFRRNGKNIRRSAH